MLCRVKRCSVGSGNTDWGESVENSSQPKRFWMMRMIFYPYIKFQKFDAFMPYMHNFSILIVIQKFPLRTYSLAKAYSQSGICGLKDKFDYSITN